jgi:MSHA pilin protein MshA
MKLNNRQAGFTLIELVVVIAILGILAAFAIPRFASLEREARVGTVLGAAGSVRSAATLAHSVFLVQGSSPILMEGVSIDLTEGYPDATDISLALADLTGFSVTVNGANDQATIQKAGVTGNCMVVYNDALPNQAPVVSVDITGC